jgi:hypothetical protein
MDDSFDDHGTAPDITDYVESGLLDIESQTMEEAEVLHKECWICGAKHGLRLHYIASRQQDPRTITVCGKCYRRLSRMQKTWEACPFTPAQSLKIRRALFFMGLRDVMSLKAQETGNINYERLAGWLTQKIKKCLEEE